MRKTGKLRRGSSTVEDGKISKKRSKKWPGNTRRAGNLTEERLLRLRPNLFI